MRGVTQLPLKKSKPCKHYHASGRRCESRVFSQSDWCTEHLKSNTRCLVCDSMRAAFPLRKDLINGEF